MKRLRRLGTFAKALALAATVGLSACTSPKGPLPNDIQVDKYKFEQGSYEAQMLQKISADIPNGMTLTLQAEEDLENVLNGVIDHDSLQSAVFGADTLHILTNALETSKVMTHRMRALNAELKQALQFGTDHLERDGSSVRTDLEGLQEVLTGAHKHTLVFVAASAVEAKKLLPTISRILAKHDQGNEHYQLETLARWRLEVLEKSLKKFISWSEHIAKQKGGSIP